MISPDLVQWMPAHSSETSVRWLACSDGTFVDHDMWCANQVCDMFAKQAANSVRVPRSNRNQLLHRQKQLRELLMYLGRVTYAANRFSRADGVVVRDSTANQALESKRRRVPDGSSKIPTANSKATEKRNVSSKGWQVGFKAGHACKSEWSLPLSVANQNVSVSAVMEGHCWQAAS